MKCNHISAFTITDSDDYSRPGTLHDPQRGESWLQAWCPACGALQVGGGSCTEWRQPAARPPDTFTLDELSEFAAEREMRLRAEIREMRSKHAMQIQAYKWFLKLAGKRC